ncbi:hypothetical protein [Altererythrobacter sp. Root672]|uniref:hypothetical protein n=1 Tax=Altererythrobacter sp. Root672 TaxID=1736584 RepID=UPI0012E3BF13|nr:hypothetical protein [Altererythrobacter sp. Root672]
MQIAGEVGERCIEATNVRGSKFRIGDPVFSSGRGYLRGSTMDNGGADEGNRPLSSLGDGEGVKLMSHVSSAEQHRGQAPLPQSELGFDPGQGNQSSGYSLGYSGTEA